MTNKTRIERSELLPCPFCGGVAARGKKCVCCTQCGVTGPYTSEDTYDDTCEKGWNNRISSTPPMQGDGWMPIESAPKDGTLVLYYSPTMDRWVGNEPRGHSRGYWDLTDGKWVGSAMSKDETHWRHLPAAPHTVEG